MRTRTALVIAFVAIFCSCCITSTNELDEPKSKPEILKNVMVSSRKGEGTGVVISDDNERGTYVLTAGHVVIFAKIQEDGLSIGKAVSDDLSITLSDGQIADAIFIAGDDERVDYAILWIPKSVGTQQSVERAVRGISGQDLLVETFSPEKSPGSYRARGFWFRTFRVTEDKAKIMFGNSGSGVYDSSEKLVAILVAKDEEGKVGSVTLIYDIMKELKVMDLDWLIRDE